jgi:hypothetical protein
MKCYLYENDKKHPTFTKSSKKAADEWIKGLWEQNIVEWQVGFMYKLKNNRVTYEFKDKNGNQLKTG